MKKLFLFLLLIGMGIAPSLATEITVSTVNIPNVNVGNIGSNQTITVTATNGSAAVTCSACLPSRYVGLSGWQVQIGGIIYTTSAAESTSAFTLSTNFAGITGSASATLYPIIELRVYASQPYQPLNATYIVQSGTPGSGVAYKRYACSVRNISGVNTVIVPTVTLDATTDTANAIDRYAKLTPYFFRTDGGKIGLFDGLANLSIPASPTTTTWAAIRTYNLPSARYPQPSGVYTTDQVNALLGTFGGISGTYRRIGMIGSTGAAVENSNLTQDVSGNITAGANLAVAGAQTVAGAATVGGQLDPAGGIKQRTSAEVAALTAGSYGRLTWQTDGLKGFKKDFGSDVGIRHAQPYYDAYELGFVPGDSASVTRVLNSSKWTAFVSALPATGGTILFPEGTFYFSSELSTTKPIQVVGAGSAFVSGGTTIGTTIVVESGENGFEFLAGASGSSVSNLHIKTRSGYSGVSTGDGIYSAVEVHIDKVSIESMGRDGVFFNGTSPANADFSSVTNVKVWGVNRDGIHYDGGNDTNVIFTSNVNCTLNGRHGFYNAGSSNIFLGCHVSYSAQVTGSGKDYYDAGSSNVYILPYAENTGSNYFYFDTGAIRSTVITGLFGAPIFDSAAPGFYGRHTILSDGMWRDLLIRGTGNAAGDHDYALISREFDEAGQFVLSDSTASKRVLDYRPTGTRLILPAVEIGQTLKMTGTPQTITGTGALTAINLTTDATLIVTTGAATTTLAAGAEGQYKTIKMKTDAGDCVATVTNLLGGTTITFNDAGDFVYLRYLDGQWIVLQNSGCTIA